MDSQRCWVWLAVMASAGACERCTWRLDAVEVAGVTMPGSTSGTQGGAAETGSSGGDSGAAGTGWASSSEGAPSTGGILATTGESPCLEVDCTETAGAGTTGAENSGPGDLGTLCGNGQVDPGEECDDGDQDNTNACTNGCDAAKCRDGYVYGGVEECDDGNLEDKDGCSNDCWAPRTVFVTADPIAGDFGGVEGADMVCKMAAAGLQGEFRAWVSEADVLTSPRFRFGSGNFAGWYVLTNGLFVARGSNGGLEGESLLVIIDRTQFGDVPLDSPQYVWSNTNQNGFTKMQVDCGSWSDVESLGAVGIRTAQNAKWTDFGTRPCNSLAHLYCFQVGPALP